MGELHEVYGGLGSGRLVIAGGPGAGKSIAAVLLILAALRYRRSVSEPARPQVPVPVLFTLHGWDPSTQRVREWLAGRLWQTYPLFAGKHGAGAARGLLDQGRIAVILDGLDEIPEDLRPAVLRALSQQATFRLVLLTRSAEMAAAAARALLQGAAAIELQDIEPGVAADYTRQPGEPPPRYDLPTAEHALRCIATRMNNHGTRDLRWWHVPAWAPAAPRFIATWLSAVLVAGTVVGLVVGLAAELGIADAIEYESAPIVGLLSGIVAGLVAGFVAGLAFGRGNKTPKRTAPLRWRQLFRRRPLVAGLLAGIVAGVVAVCLVHWFVSESGLPGWIAVGAPEFGLFSGTVVGLEAWLGAGIIAGMSVPGTDNTSPLSPLSSWRSDQAFGRRLGFMVWLGLTLAYGLMFGVGSSVAQVAEAPFIPGPPGVSEPGLLQLAWPAFGGQLLPGLGIGLVFGLVAGLVYSQSWSSSLAFAQLAVTDRTPVRLMRFLEDARHRGVLRTVGPVYQFRHARLQDRLASQPPATGQSHGEPHPAAADTAAPTAEAPPASAR